MVHDPGRYTAQRSYRAIPYLWRSHHAQIRILSRIVTLLVGGILVGWLMRQWLTG